MSEQVCLRCDWSGEAGGTTCPECGAVLYRMSPAKPVPPVRRRVAPPPPREDVFVPVVEREPARTRPSLRRRIVAIAVAAIAAAAIATIELRTPSGSVAVHAPGLSDSGTLVYAAKDPQGWVLWSWDLATGIATEGPRVDHPLDLVSAAQASPGWIGLTTAEGRLRTASVLHSLSPEGRPSRIASGNLVTWSAGGADVTSLSYGRRTHGCVRHVEIRSWTTTFGNGDTRFNGPLCGLPVAIARDGTFDYVVSMNGPEASIRIIGAGYTKRFMDGHLLLGLSTRGDFLVMPVPHPRDRPGHLTAGLAPGLQLYHRPPLNEPVSFGSAGQPLQPLAFLTWSWDASEAYLLGSYEGVRGVYRVTIAPGVGLRVPELVEQTQAATVDATVTSDGDLFLLLDGRLWFERADRIAPIALPAGAPQPAGPLLWVPPGGAASGLA